MRFFQLCRCRGRGRVAALAFAGVLATLTDLPQAAAQEPTVEPFKVIDHALVRWRSRPRPAQLSYVVDFTGWTKDRSFRRLFRVEHSVADQSTRVTILQSDGPAPPFVQPEKARLLPTETFGFVPSDMALPLATPPPAATTLPVIAAVHATLRYPYDVSFVGIEKVANRLAYHLQLEPRQTPDAFPLRQMWIDASTFDVLQVEAQQFEHLGPIAVPYRLRAWYAEQGPYWLIAHAEAGATIRAGFFSYRSTGDADFEDFQYTP
jgi:negative regulator of sigma E activity